jgi:hypothetical protein
MTHKAGMYRPTLIMRQNEAEYAIRKARKSTWVDSKNIFLMGHSEGGIIMILSSVMPMKMHK